MQEKMHNYILILVLSNKESISIKQNKNAQRRGKNLYLSQVCAITGLSTCNLHWLFLGHWSSVLTLTSDV